MRIEGLGTQSDNKFLFNGKELTDDFGLNWYEYGWRTYDAQLGRWHQVDPLDQFNSPYCFVSNNPANLVDFDGLYGGDPELVYIGQTKIGDNPYVAVFELVDMPDQSFSFDELFSSLWNSDWMRSRVPDFITISYGFSGIASVGAQVNVVDFNWVTRGPEASWKPMLTNTAGIGAGWNIDLGYNVGGANYMGPVGEIRRSMIPTGNVKDPASWTYWGSASGILPVTPGFGAEIGVYGTIQRAGKSYIVGRGVSIGGAITAPVPPYLFNAASGVSGTFKLHDFYEGEK
ncbi:hypothetical protein K1X84_10080 [bacterium]|nr:hypothetical protein [bacterium]